MRSYLVKGHELGLATGAMAVADIWPHVVDLHVARVSPHLEFIQLAVVHEPTEHDLDLQ